MDKYSRFLVVCLRFPKEPGMYQLGTLSLGAGSRMDLVPVWWGGEGEKGTLLSKSSPREAAQAPCNLSLVCCDGRGDWEVLSVTLLFKVTHSGQHYK